MNDPVVLLKKDHREAETMLKTLASSRPGARRRATVEKLVAALQLHMAGYGGMAAGCDFAVLFRRYAL